MNSDQDTLYFSQWPNLADPRLGAAVISATDDFFGDKSRLIKPEKPVFIEGKYDNNGKWMDGWETRRKRSEGYDYCIIKLGQPSFLSELEVDTSHFTGNYPSAVSIDACFIDDMEDGVLLQSKTLVWHEVVAPSSVSGDSVQLFDVSYADKVTHLRLNIYPDGGVARLRVYGRVALDQSLLCEDKVMDLLAIENGGRAIVANDEHFGQAKNMLMPERSDYMGDGWETRRRRQPGNDWAIFQLATPGRVEKIEVDTGYFKGNFPDSCSIQAAFVEKSTDDSLVSQSLFWKELLPAQALTMDAIHTFEKELAHQSTVSHIRFNIYPDGGISRLRLFGKPSISEFC